MVNFRLAQQFKVPEKLDVSYKFFNGKMSFKDIFLRLSGLPFALLGGGLVYGLTKLFPLTLMVAVIFLAVGFWFGGKKVFNKQMLLIQALIFEKRMNDRPAVLINTRNHNKVQYKETRQAVLKHTKQY